VKIKRGSTSVRRLIFIADTSSTTGAGLANLVFNSASLVAYYFAGDLNNEVQITLVTATLGTFTSGGFIAVDNTNMPGWYEIGIPDAALDGGNEVAIQLQGATNMAPVNIYIEIDAVDYQDATAFGLSRIDAAITSRMATYTQPTGFLAATFPTTVASPTNITAATGVVLSGVTHTGAVIPTVSTVTNGVTVTTNNDKTGYSLSQSFPSNFASLGINASGHISRVVLVDTVSAVTGLTASNLDAAISSRLAPTVSGRTLDVTATGAAGIDWGNIENQGSQVILYDTSIQNVTSVDQTDSVISLAAGATISGGVDDEIAAAVAATQALSRLDSMIESDGAGQFRFDTIALEQAPAGGGGGGGTDWTSDERTAIRSILGFDSSGTVSLPTVGVMDAIKDKTDLITSSGISVVEDRVNLSTITMQYNESTTATVNLDENTTSATLQFVVSRPDGTDVLTIANGSITRTSTSFTVTITTAVTATLGQYLWSLRDITGGTNRVVTKGVLTVQNAASV
jgi:hypothetical protein